MRSGEAALKLRRKSAFRRRVAVMRAGRGEGGCRCRGELRDRRAWVTVVQRACGVA